MVSTAEEGTITIEPLSLMASYSMFMARRCRESTQAKAIDRRTGQEEPPEPLVGGKLDLGAIATEFLLLGIDPYPRKAGAELGPIRADDGSAQPFAALEALKKRLGGS